MEAGPADVVGEGFDPCFLRRAVTTPEPGEAIRGDLLTWEGGTALPYAHFSLAMSVSRRFAYWVAWNIDGGALKRLGRQGLGFSLDPRIPSDAQVGNDFYADNRLDRGHLARRADLTWGSDDEAWQANRDSFRYTNVTPQMDDFNQSSRQGLWGRLEDALYEGVEIDELKASVVAGPVFRVDDQGSRGVGIPREYWKVLAYRQEGTLNVAAFLLTQDFDRLRALVALDEFRVYQVGLVELEERTGLVYPAALHEVGKPAQGVRGTAARAPLKDAADIRW